MDQSSSIALAATSGVLLISNLFGNTLVCVVILHNRKMRTPLNYLLFNLAVTDAIIGVFSIPMIVFGFIPNKAEGTAALLLCKFIVHGTVILLCSQVSAYSLAAIAFERYQAVIHPLKVKQNVTKRKTFLFITITWILAICITIPWFLGLDLDGGVPQKCKVKAEYKEALKIHSYIFGLFAFAVLLVVMSVLYARVIREVLKKQNQIGEANQQVAFRTKKRIVVMLITVTLIFATLWAVALAFHIVYGYTPGNFAAAVIFCLVLINSSINWVLYTLFSKQFRNCFKRALCGCSKTKPRSGGYPRVQENPMRNGVVDTRL